LPVFFQIAGIPKRIFRKKSPVGAVKVAESVKKADFSFDSDGRNRASAILLSMKFFGGRLRSSPCVNAEHASKNNSAHGRHSPRTK
jgi:hypothetical protein